MNIFTRDFPWKIAEARGALGGLVKEMNGSPVRGFCAAKIGFGTELLLRLRPTTIKEIIPFVDEESDVVKRAVSNLTPLAFNLRNRLPSMIPETLLRTPDGTEISLFVTGLLDRFPIRDMDADHLWYVHEGSGWCSTDLGWFEYEPGDLVYIPRSMLSYFEAQPGTPDQTVLIGIQTPKGLRLRSGSPFENGDVPFNQEMMKIPQPWDTAGTHVTTVIVRRDGKFSQVEYEYTPFLCTAWKGTIYPFALPTSALHFAYTTSIHADPTNFGVFAAADGSVMISVLGARFVHSLPYHHLNLWDEFLFYAKGYDARKGAGGEVGQAGTATLHPQGIWHGPQPTALEAWRAPVSLKDIPWVDDLAIMFETQEPLRLCARGQRFLIPDYEHSWSEK